MTSDQRNCQAQKIREIATAVTAAGFTTLDEQARVLGLSRSTTWTILQPKHKTSGLSTAVIQRMLSAPTLPITVRARLIEYLQEKALGRYGHNESQLRRFRGSLSRFGLANVLASQETSSAATSLRPNAIA